MKAAVEFSYQTSTGGRDNQYLIKAADTLLPTMRIIEYETDDELDAKIEAARQQLLEEVYKYAQQLYNEDGNIGRVSTIWDTLSIVVVDITEVQQ